MIAPAETEGIRVAWRIRGSSGVRSWREEWTKVHRMVDRKLACGMSLPKGAGKRVRSNPIDLAGLEDCRKCWGKRAT